jgi:hypothetical protein
VEVLLNVTPAGQSLIFQLIADTGAATSQAGFELILREHDCLACGGVPSHPVTLGGAYVGSFPVYVVRVEIPALGFDRQVRAAAASCRRLRSSNSTATKRNLRRIRASTFASSMRESSQIPPKSPILICKSYFFAPP